MDFGKVWNHNPAGTQVKASPCDVYIAINAFYHDLGSVLKTWFGSNIDEKVIILAITFWFKDDDYQGNKLMDYFE